LAYSTVTSQNPASNAPNSNNTEMMPGTITSDLTQTKLGGFHAVSKYLFQLGGHESE